MTSSLPRVSPLVVKPRAAAFDDPNWLFELKYDGFRALLEIDGSGARLLSRNRNRFRHLDPLAAALAKRLRVNDAILDGEIICADETGRRLPAGKTPAWLLIFTLTLAARTKLVRAAASASAAGRSAAGTGAMRES